MERKEHDIPESLTVANEDVHSVYAVGIDSRLGTHKNGLCDCCYPRNDQISENLGRKSTILTCSNCRNCITTQIQHVVSTRTHVTALFCCTIGCCWYPYMAKKYKNVRHYCPVCKVYLGTCSFGKRRPPIMTSASIFSFWSREI